MALKTYGLMGVDWEERVNFERLRTERLVRIKKLLKEAYANSLGKVTDKSQLRKGQTIVKSISPVKKRPGPITAKKK